MHNALGQDKGNCHLELQKKLENSLHCVVKTWLSMYIMIHCLG